jgi:hypothetical protein
MDPRQEAYLQQRTNQILRAHIQNGTAALYGSGVTAGGRCPKGSRKDPKTGKCKKYTSAKKAVVRKTAAKRPCARKDGKRGRASLMKPNRKKCPKDYYNIVNYPYKYVSKEQHIANINRNLLKKGLVTPNEAQKIVINQIKAAKKAIDEGKEPRDFIPDAMSPEDVAAFFPYPTVDNGMLPPPMDYLDFPPGYEPPVYEGLMFPEGAGYGRRRRRGGVTSGGCEACGYCCGGGCGMCGGSGVLVGGATYRRCPKGSTGKIIRYNACRSNKTGKRVKNLEGTYSTERRVKKSGSKSAKSAKAPSKWNKHVKAYWNKHPNLTLAEASSAARKTYKPVKK